MANETIKSLDTALAQVKQDRRGFLKTLIVGSTIAAIPAMTSQAMAQDTSGTDAKKKKKKKEGE